jgi:hypothetical protein
VQKATGRAAWACDQDGSHGYRQSRVYGYSYAPRAYGYYAPADGYRTAYLDGDDYDYDYGYGYGYGGVAVGVDVVRDRRIHRRHAAGKAVNIGARDGRVREGAPRASSEQVSATRGAGSGAAAGTGGGMTGSVGRVVWKEAAAAAASISRKNILGTHLGIRIDPDPKARPSAQSSPYRPQARANELFPSFCP